MQYKEYGYIPAALPDTNCYGAGSGNAESQPKATAASSKQMAVSSAGSTKPLSAPSQAFSELLDKVLIELIKTCVFLKWLSEQPSQPLLARFFGA